MKVHAYFGFFAVGAVLLFFGLLLLLAVPAAAVLVLVLGLLHLGVGTALRSHSRRRAPSA